MKKSYFAIILMLLGGCTQITVEPLSVSLNVSHICIKENPKVIVPDFLSVVQKEINECGITTKVYKEVTANDGCSAILTYTARRSWDMGTYLSHAELIIEDEKRKQLSKAVYHLIGKGGFSLMKWQGVETKMKPVMDEMLKEYK